MQDTNNAHAYFKHLEKLHDRIVPSRPPGYDEPEARPLETMNGSKIGAILVQGLGSTSDPTNKERFHLGLVACLLEELRIPFLVFSYKGPHDLNYCPWDTDVNFAHKAAELESYVLALDAEKVILIAHSQGGNIVASWINDYARSEHLDRIAATFFLSSPVFLPSATLVRAVGNGQEYGAVLDVVDGYNFQPDELSDKLRQQFTVLRCWKDLLAPFKYSSFLNLGRAKAPLSEIVIQNASHSDIARHYITLSTIRTYILQCLIS